MWPEHKKHWREYNVAAAAHFSTAIFLDLFIFELYFLRNFLLKFCIYLFYKSIEANTMLQLAVPIFQLETRTFNFSWFNFFYFFLYWKLWRQHNVAAGPSPLLHWKVCRPAAKTLPQPPMISCRKSKKKTSSKLF